MSIAYLENPAPFTHTRVGGWALFIACSSLYNVSCAFSIHKRLALLSEYSKYQLESKEY